MTSDNLIEKLTATIEEAIFEEVPAATIYGALAALTHRVEVLYTAEIYAEARPIYKKGGK